MNMNELKEYLKEYNHIELFYREYYFSKKNPEVYKKFMANLDLEYIKKYYLVIPELKILPDSLYIPEDAAFTSLDKFNVRVFKQDRYTPLFKHKHSFFEMIYVYSGHCEENINGDIINLNEGDICIVPPDVEHTLGVFDDSIIIIKLLIRKSTFDDTFLEILSEESILSSFFSKILYTKNYNNYITFRTNNNNLIRTFISQMIIEAKENKKYSNTMLDHFLMILYGHLLRDETIIVELPKELQKGNEQLSQILIFIQSNFKTVTLEQLSTKFNFSVAHLSRLIKLHTGHNFKEMIQTLKLNKAIELLTFSNLKILDISEIIGYENTTHFIRTFKKVYGISPNQYRKDVLDKTENSQI
jgi:AraC-like DNA-binding protein